MTIASIGFDYPVGALLLVIMLCSFMLGLAIGRSFKR